MNKRKSGVENRESKLAHKYSRQAGNPNVDLLIPNERHPPAIPARRQKTRHATSARPKKLKNEEAQTCHAASYALHGKNAPIAMQNEACSKKL